AVYRETNLKWALFIGAWTTGLAYMAATLFYQAATLMRHPLSSLVWIALMATIFAGVVLTMRYMGKAAKAGLREPASRTRAEAAPRPAR
ncbi:MAG: hypothetical protein KFF50_13215, partial [Desulfatitalea sp.]|nr:hypothetical protein [Desulfatitalea sp.]